MINPLQSSIFRLSMAELALQESEKPRQHRCFHHVHIVHPCQYVALRQILHLKSYRSQT